MKDFMEKIWDVFIASLIGIVIDDFIKDFTATKAKYMLMGILLGMLALELWWEANCPCP